MNKNTLLKRLEAGCISISELGVYQNTDQTFSRKDESTRSHSSSEWDTEYNYSDENYSASSQHRVIPQPVKSEHPPYKDNSRRKNAAIVVIILLLLVLLILIYKTAYKSNGTHSEPTYDGFLDRFTDICKFNSEFLNDDIIDFFKQNLDQNSDELIINKCTYKEVSSNSNSTVYLFEGETIIFDTNWGIRLLFTIEDDLTQQIKINSTFNMDLFDFNMLCIFVQSFLGSISFLSEISICEPFIKIQSFELNSFGDTKGTYIKGSSELFGVLDVLIKEIMDIENYDGIISVSGQIRPSLNLLMDWNYVLQINSRVLLYNVGLSIIVPSQTEFIGQNPEYAGGQTITAIKLKGDVFVNNSTTLIEGNKIYTEEFGESIEQVKDSFKINVAGCLGRDIFSVQIETEDTFTLPFIWDYDITFEGILFGIYYKDSSFGCFINTSFFLDQNLFFSVFIDYSTDSSDYAFLFVLSNANMHECSNNTYKELLTNSSLKIKTCEENIEKKSFPLNLFNIMKDNGVEHERTINGRVSVIFSTKVGSYNFPFLEDEIKISEDAENAFYINVLVEIEDIPELKEWHTEVENENTVIELTGLLLSYNEFKLSTHLENINISILSLDRILLSISSFSPYFTLDTEMTIEQGVFSESQINLTTKVTISDGYWYILGHLNTELNFNIGPTSLIINKISIMFVKSDTQASENEGSQYCGGIFGSLSGEATFNEIRYKSIIYYNGMCSENQGCLKFELIPLPGDVNNQSFNSLLTSLSLEETESKIESNLSEEDYNELFNSDISNHSLDINIGCSFISIYFTMTTQKYGELATFVEINFNPSNLGEELVLDDKGRRQISDTIFYFKLKEISDYYFVVAMKPLDEIDYSGILSGIPDLNYSDSFLVLTSDKVDFYKDDTVILNATPGLTVSVLIDSSVEELNMVSDLITTEDYAEGYENFLLGSLYIGTEGILLTVYLTGSVKLSDTTSMAFPSLQMGFSVTNGFFFMAETTMKTLLFGTYYSFYLNSTIKPTSLSVLGVMCQKGDSLESSITEDDMLHCSNWLQRSVLMGNYSDTSLIDLQEADGIIPNTSNDETGSPLMTFDLTDSASLEIKEIIVEGLLSKDVIGLYLKARMILASELECTGLLSLETTGISVSLEFRTNEKMPFGHFIDIIVGSFGCPMPREIEEALNEWFYIYTFKAEMALGTGTYLSFEMFISYHDEEKDEWFDYGITFLIGKVNKIYHISLQITNEEGVPLPPIPIVKEILEFLGIEVVYIGTNTDSSMYEVGDFIDDFEGSFKIPLEPGFFMITPVEIHSNKTLEEICKFLGIPGAVFGGVIGDEFSWRLSLYLKFIETGSFIYLESGSLFLIRNEFVMLGFGISVNVVVELTEDENDHLTLYGEAYFGLSMTGLVLSFTVGMMEDWVNPLGFYGLTIKQTILSFTASPYPLKIGEILLKGGASFWEFSIDVLFYANFSREREMAIIYSLVNFSLIELLESIFNIDMSCFDWLDISFKNLEFYLVIAKETFTISIPGYSETLEPGFKLIAEEFNFFNIFKGSVAIEIITGLGFIAKGLIEPFKFVFIEVRGFPNEDDPLLFDFEFGISNFKIFFQGYIKLFILEVLGDVDIDKSNFKVYLKIRIDWFGVEIVIKGISGNQLSNIETTSFFYLSFELMDDQFLEGSTQEEDEPYYESKQDSNTMSGTEALNQRPEGNITDTRIESEEEFSDPYEEKAREDESESEDDYEDAEEATASLYSFGLDKTSYAYKNDSRYGKHMKKTRVLDRINEIKREIAVLENNINSNYYSYSNKHTNRTNKIKEYIMRDKRKIDSLRYLCNLMKAKYETKYGNEVIDIMKVEFYNLGFFDWLLGGLKEIWDAFLDVLNFMLDLIEMLVKFLVELIKCIIRIIYLYGATTVNADTGGVKFDTYVHIKLFSSINIEFCVTLKIGNFDEVQYEAGNSALENDDDVNSQKEDIAHEGEDYEYQSGGYLLYQEICG
eukprot:GAHX01001993.1.p1 GENE.GAHX01001993.1~~GAHX01001993.1.p1  ORF type:complete len:1978 (-),score=399.16 GAHX01001993.1:43-5976(-)